MIILISRTLYILANFELPYYLLPLCVFLFAEIRPWKVAQKTQTGNPKMMRRYVAMMFFIYHGFYY